MSVAEARVGHGCKTAPDYAWRLLADLGRSFRLNYEPEHPALAWARSGLMALTGQTSPQMCPLPIAACADGALLALQSLAPDNLPLRKLRGSRLLTERASLMGLKRKGKVAPGGSCRLVDTADGRIALNLAREDDWTMLPAWLESKRVSGEPDDWASLAVAVKQKPVAELVERGRMMGLAVSADEAHPDCGNWFSVVAEGPRSIRAEPSRQPLVLDLSSLWAGPLCGHLLQLMGARVIKVESTTRPDGAREGNEDFYNLLNTGKASLALDLKSEAGREQLRALIMQADIVIESARPRALRQMGIVAEELVQDRPGLTWVGISGYGREGKKSEWVGFGDDAGVAAGLSAVMFECTGKAMFVGDAIADPLAGLHAALAAWHGHLNGGGQLLSLALRDVTAHCVNFDRPPTIEALRNRQAEWSAMVQGMSHELPAPRRSQAAARPLGADNDNILRTVTQ